MGIYKEFDTWLDEFEDELYIEYMETGTYYELDKEFIDFCEDRYNLWLRKLENPKGTSVRDQ
jgi:hypothetical protein